MNPLESDEFVDSYLRITPAGCFHAVESRHVAPERACLLGLMSTTKAPRFGSFSEAAAGLENSVMRPSGLLDLVDAGFIELAETADYLRDGNVESVLPSILPALSDCERVVLSESRQGLFLDYIGFSSDEAEELAVIASGLRAFAERSAPLLAERLAINTRAFGIIDPAGHSEIGFWPLYIGDNVFTLTILGIPRFNSAAFKQLVWTLVERYGDTTVK